MLRWGTKLLLEEKLLWGSKLALGKFQQFKLPRASFFISIMKNRVNKSYSYMKRGFRKKTET